MKDNFNRCKRGWGEEEEAEKEKYGKERSGRVVKVPSGRMVVKQKGKQESFLK